jgi:hypothetical protein
LLDSFSSGTARDSVVVTSTSGIKAIIHGGNNASISISGASYYHIYNLSLTGSGRKTGNTKNGLLLDHTQHIACDSLDISGFQKAGAMVFASHNILLNNIYVHENGAAGIAIKGITQKSDCRDIMVTQCRAENNPGDPSELKNHSGNGIIAGICMNVVIDHCVANNNGWDMPRIGNGPVGIWCYEADSVTIQHCTSFQNKTSPGGADGGGFDLDGGVTNSVIQYCLSYENQGSGYGIFQYAGASTWSNNTVQFCISKNDGYVSVGKAGVFIWNTSDDPGQLHNLLFCNNIIDNDRVAAINYDMQSENSGFRFLNNTFIVRGEFITGKSKPAVFTGNQWIRKTE